MLKHQSFRDEGIALSLSFSIWLNFNKVTLQQITWEGQFSLFYTYTRTQYEHTCINMHTHSLSLSLKGQVCLLEVYDYILNSQTEQES